MRNIKTGVSIKVPKSKSDFSNWARVIIVNNSFGKAKVETKKSKGKKVKVITDKKTPIDVYQYSATEKSDFAIDIDKKVIRDCYSGIRHTSTEIKTGHFVSIDMTPVPAVVCRPSQHRDIQIGTTIEVNNNQYKYKKLYVEKDTSYGDSVIFRDL